MRLGQVPAVMALGGIPLADDDTQVLEVYVASQNADGEHVGTQVHSAWVDNVQRAVCEIAGGCTTYHAYGSWLNPDTRLIQSEGVIIVRTSVTRGKLLAGAAKLRQVLVQYGRECEQHTVAFSLDGELFGINPKEQY